jgi:hypothetical protein
LTTDLLKSQLIEELGVYFENNRILTPLASRIFSMLILSDPEGICFDVKEKLKNPANNNSQ